MLNSGKKISRFARQKKINSNSCIVRKKISERNKKPYPPPPFKLNGRSLICYWSVIHFLGTKYDLNICVDIFVMVDLQIVIC